ncbi:MAG: hypothetical protein LBU98_03885 [Alistipes sp.]|jgi:hypothetical protein|nr:hypothetical protein [Alistipes sp.]
MKIYFQRVRRPDGAYAQWNVIAGLPDEWPEGSITEIYWQTGNRLYYVPGDHVRYYEMLDGAVCRHCGRFIDKSWMFHAESLADRDKCLCGKCWNAVGRDEPNFPKAIGDLPLYRLKNGPGYKNQNNS